MRRERGLKLGKGGLRENWERWILDWLIDIMVRMKGVRVDRNKECIGFDLR